MPGEKSDQKIKYEKLLYVETGAGYKNNIIIYINCAQYVNIINT